MIDLRKLRLGGLYSITGTDWVLNLHHILTEPTVPSCVIAPEGWRIARYRVDCDTLEESLTKAVDLVRSEIIERKVLGSYAPYTNPDDDVFAKWLYARAAGSDDLLPDVPGRRLPEEFEWILDGFLAKNKEGTKALVEKGGAVHAYVTARVRRYLGDCRLDYDAADAMVKAKLAALK